MTTELLTKEEMETLASYARQRISLFDSRPDHAEVFEEEIFTRAFLKMHEANARLRGIIESFVDGDGDPHNLAFARAELEKDQPE